MFTWNAHKGAVTSLAFGPDARFLVSAGADECVKVWDTLTGAEQFIISLRLDDMLRMPGDAVGPLRHLVVSGDGARAVVAQPSVGLVFLDLERKEEMFSLPLGEVRALKPAVDATSLFALACGPRGGAPSLRRYDCADGQLRDSIDLPVWRGPHALGVSPDGSRVAAGETVFEWPPHTPYPAKGGINSKQYIPDDLAFSADMQHLFALVGGKVVVYSLPHGMFETKLKGHCGRITAMALTPDGRRLWTASRDATVKCWDTFSLTLDRTYTFQTGGLDCLAVSSDGNVAAVGSGQKGTITLWDLG